MRRLLVASGLIALVLAAGLVYARWHATRDVHGSPSVEFVLPTTTAATTTAPTTTAPRRARPRRPLAPGTAWTTYGFDTARTRVSPSGGIRPPFRQLWMFRASRLLEFPPAIAGGRVYLPVFDGRLYALDARSGRVLWERRSPRCIWATPALARGLLLMTYINRYRPNCNVRSESRGGGELKAFETRTGAVRWDVSLPPTESSPLILGDQVIVGDWEGWLRSYRLADGRLLWRSRVGGAIKGSAASAGGRLYVGAYDGRLYCFDRRGRQLWSAAAQPSMTGSRGTFYSTPAVAYGRVYIGSTGGKVYSFGARSGLLRWSFSTGGYVYGSPAVWNGLVLVGSYDGWFYGLDAATGAVRWRFHDGGRVSGAATVLGGLVYFSTLEQRTYALDAATGRLAWTYPDGKYSPVVDDGTHLYLVGYGRLYALDPVGKG